MFIVTVAALLMAASLGWFAYRLMREEQRRSEARVAVLAAALDGDHTVGAEVPRATQVGFVSTPAFAPRLATPRTPDVVYLEDDTRQVRAFRSEHATADEVPAIDGPLQDVSAQEWATSESLPADVVEARRGGLLGAEVEAAASPDLRRFIALGGLVLVSLIAVAYLLFGRPSAPAAAAASTPSPVSAAVAATGVPLELRALAHERKGDVLVVRGRVKNPVAGSGRARLVASVMLLDQAGGFLGSARTAIDSAQLNPGAEAGFAVELPAHKDGRRYRVTFRAPDGALVPHVDKR